ncbi:restriction endonuclease subunit S, partial [Aeromonas rivipollensis]|uniref:restriction endonuclease subunit S n=1 Tax=Aeromonas rivipollensis TaxID=948519 RepID=UPI003D1EDB79
PGLSAEKLRVLKLITPTSEEQTAIATILSDMDNELTALEQKLAKAQAIKQGMMQQLLTGKIRLPLPKEV